MISRCAWFLLKLLLRNRHLEGGKGQRALQMLPHFGQLAGTVKMKEALVVAPGIWDILPVLGEVMD